MLISVRCKRCGIAVGSVDTIHYNDGCGEFTDYVNFEGNENYRGEIDDEKLCYDCYEEALEEKTIYEGECV